MRDIEAWRALAKQADAMENAALAHDWDALIDLDERFRRALDALRTAPVAALSPGELGEKATLIRHIMSCQDLVREHVEPWMRDVEPLLERFSRVTPEA